MIKSMQLLRELPSPTLGIERLMELEIDPHAKAWIWNILLENGKQYVSHIPNEMRSSSNEALIDLEMFLIKYKLIDPTAKLIETIISDNEVIVTLEKNLAI